MTTEEATTGATVDVFIRDDGQAVDVVDGFRDRVLAAPGVSVQPKPEWSDADYRRAAAKKIRHAESFVQEFLQLGGVLEGARMLEVGCGAGIDSLLMAMHPVRSVLGIDLELPLFDAEDRGQRTRRLAREVLTGLGVSEGIEGVLQQRPVRFEPIDATRMAFPDNSFDLLWSRAALEHIVPIERLLAEIARVVRPGGLIHHAIDPFYWLKGCHKRGVVDIPWAHARLTPAEYHRFVTGTEGAAKASIRSRHLHTLNHLTPRQWRRTLDTGPFEILEWREESSPFAEALLEEHHNALQTRLDGLEPTDLTCRTIKVWIRNKGSPAERSHARRSTSNQAPHQGPSPQLL